MGSSIFTISFIVLCNFLTFSSQNELDSTDDLALIYLKWKYKHDHNEILRHSLASGDHSVFFENSNEFSSHNSSQIYENCQAFIFEFAKQASRFIECTIDNARPFRFCEGCVEHYQKAKTVYSDINLNDKTQSDCQSLLLNSDRVQVINTVYADFVSIWTSADCDKCFVPDSISEDDNGTVKFTLRDSTVKFLQLYANFTKCIPRNITEFQHNHTICQDCAFFYNQMNDMFDKLLNDETSPQHVCMDIVDMMNYTRLLWGEKLKCTKFHKDYASIILIAVGLLCIPPVFYICMKVYGTRKEKEIIRQKRLSIYNQDNTFSDTVTVITSSQSAQLDPTNSNYTVTSVPDTHSTHQNSIHDSNSSNSSIGHARKRPNPNQYGDTLQANSGLES